MQLLTVVRHNFYTRTSYLAIFMILTSWNKFRKPIRNYYIL